MTVRGLMTLMLLLLGAGTAVAQKGPPGSRLTMSAGMLTSGGYGIGDAAAQMRRSAPGPESLVTVLRAESRIGTATGLDARLAWALNNDVAVEVGGSYMAPTLGVTISQDAEVPGAMAAERLAQFATEVSALYHLSISGAASRVRPYIVGGVGYLWQVREDRVTRETGRTIHTGGGVNYSVRSGVRGRPFGVRGEARFVHRSGGIEFQDKGRNYPTVSVLAFFGL
jgi:hypothetical protein